MKRDRIILHVDDDEAVLRIVSAKLTACDYEVVSLNDPTKAITTLTETGARLVLLDIDMPQINGLDLLDEIKRNDGGIQAIMLTGLVSMGTVLQSMRVGAEACVFKPISNYEPLLVSLEAAFDKIDRWWNSLNDLKQRKTCEEHASTTH